MRRCVYTCITNGYDIIKPHVPDDWDFICYTDGAKALDNAVGNQGWEIRNISSKDNPHKQQRELKIYNEEIFDNYDMSVWVDGSILINSPISKFVENNHKSDFSLMWHPGWDCVYKEAQACIQLKKDKEKTIRRQMRGYLKEGMPASWGNVQTGVMIRNHTDEVIRQCGLWWDEVKNKSHRDQLSFTYICWKYDFKYHTFNPNCLFNEFILCRHDKQVIY